MKTIFVVDDEHDILQLISLHLKKAGFNCKTFSVGSGVVEAVSANPPDLIILDLMLPDADGVSICRRLKQEKITRNIPVIMLTARTSEDDLVGGLDAGADDYITKPFSPKELIARVKAVLRRWGKEADGKLRQGAIVLDENKFEVEYRGDRIELTTTEFKILQLLMSKPGWVFSRDQILDSLWGHEKYVTDRTVDVHIRHLREKLGDAASHIKNVRGVGYKFRE